MHIPHRLLRWPCVLALTLATWGAVVGAGTAVAAVPGWQAPLSPLTVTRPFEPPPTPYASGHRGVDLAGHPGEHVVAAANGVVGFAGRLAGRGVVVVVHGDLRTTYEPVIAPLRRGTPVVAGEQIATLATGHAGCPVSACLHWGLLRGDTYLDPLSKLGGRTIRLLPLEEPAGGAGPVIPAVIGDAVLRSAAGRPAPDVPGGRWGPSPVAWSLAALAGGGVVVAFRRR